MRDSLVMSVIWLAAILAGCGSDGSPVDALVGGWIVGLPDQPCAGGFYVSADSRYEKDVLCILSGNSGMLQAVIGRIDADGSVITTWPELSSCPDATRAPTSVRYNVDPEESLTILGDASATVFDWAQDDGSHASGGLVLQTGCFVGGVDPARFVRAPVLRIP